MKKFLLCLALCMASIAPTQCRAAETTTQKSYQTIMLYYTSSCPYCHEVTDYLHSIQKTVPMKNLNGDAEGQDELKKAGGQVSVPALVVDGKAMYGSDAINAWIKQHQNELAAE